MIEKRDTPSYNQIEISLPALPGGPSLPPFIYFDLDTRFTSAQTIRIRNLIVGVINTWLQHFQQKETCPYLSRFSSCAQKYALHGLTPLWSDGPPVTSGIEAANLAMNALTQRFIENGADQANASRINCRPPERGEHYSIRAETSEWEYGVSLSVTINPQVLDNPVVANLSLIGSMFHAWLHRMGFEHPATIYTTYFIGEAPMCIMRSFQCKNPDVSDTVFTQFFD